MSEKICLEGDARGADAGYRPAMFAARANAVLWTKGGWNFKGCFIPEVALIVIYDCSSGSWIEIGGPYCSGLFTLAFRNQD